MTIIHEKYLADSAAAKKEAIPLTPGPGEPEEKFLERRVAAERAYMGAIEAGPIFQAAIRSFENLIANPTIPDTQKAFAKSVVAMVKNPAAYELGETGEDLRTLTRVRIEEIPGEPAEVIGVGGIPSIEVPQVVQALTKAKTASANLASRGRVLLSDTSSQIKQWIGYYFLDALGQLPAGFTKESILKRTKEQLDEQARQYLRERDGFIGSVNFTDQMRGFKYVIDEYMRQEPVGINPFEVIKAAVDDLEGQIKSANANADIYMAQLKTAYLTQDLTPEEREMIRQVSIRYNFQLIPADVQQRLNELRALGRSTNPEDRSKLRQELARLVSLQTMGGEEGAEATFLLDNLGM